MLPGGGGGGSTFTGGAVTLPIKYPDGSAAAPSVTFTADDDSGFYRIGANNVGLSLGGTVRVDWNTTRVNFASNYQLIAGANTLISSDKLNGAQLASFPGCSTANQFVRSIASSGTATCAAIADADLAGITQTGTNGFVRATSPTLVTPVLGAATATSLTLPLGAAATPALIGPDADTGLFFLAASAPFGNRVVATSDGTALAAVDSVFGLVLHGSFFLDWSGGANITTNPDVGLFRAAAGVLGVNTGQNTSTYATLAASTFKTMTALVALGGGAAPTLGTIGGSGPATAGQNTWLLMKDSTGASFWVPAWK